MARRTALLVALALGLVLATPAAGDNSGKIAQLEARISAARRHESALGAQISGVTSRIRTLERRVGGVTQRLGVLEQDLALHRERLDKLNALYSFETNRLVFLRRQYARVLGMLNHRLVELYESPDASTAEVLLEARSVEQAIDELQYIRAIAAQDRRITFDVRTARDEMRLTRAKTAKIRVGVKAETQAVAVRTQEQQSLRGSLLASHSRLARTRIGERSALAKTRQAEEDMIAEADALAAADARIRAQLAQGGTPSTPSSSGLIWPVNGPVVSPFGMRWGRLHAGIDIAVPTGTPIHAAAAGTVVIAGWVSGYGNYTCINHGGGLATCYAHQESFAVSVGQSVTQGQVIGYSDCTGHCFGPHLHFEVRVNGTPVDPMGYL
jgi:murein DD-endopeptidase MepM/ murein hydrolase activator NlpD